MTEHALIMCRELGRQQKPKGSEECISLISGGVTADTKGPEVGVCIAFEGL